MKIKTTDSFFNIGKREAIGENESKIYFTSLHILKYYTNDLIIELEESFFEALY